MKKLYILITLGSLLLLTASCKTILQKDKYSELNQSNSKLDRTLNSRKLNSSDLNSNRLLIQNDTLNYWAWIQSSGFFHYHPETGFSGENGEVWINGNRNTQRLEEQNLLESKMVASDSLIREQSTTNENSKITEQSQKSKSRNTAWWIIAGIGLTLIMGFRFWKTNQR